MAYLAQLGAQTDELLAAVLPAVEPRKRNALRQSCIRTFNHHPYGRTNQFKVDEQLTGLEERFRVIGREPLGDALQTRLEALKPHEQKWIPELLHFLLELSDQPAQKTDLRDLDLLAPPEQELEAQLTWRDIAREDGWDDDRALWQTINYADSSDEEVFDVEPEATTHSEQSSVDCADKLGKTAQDLALPSAHDSLLSGIETSEAWRHAQGADDRGRTRKMALTEYQALREVLFMLGGLETTVFTSKGDFLPDYQIIGVYWETHRALLSSCAECGRNLRPLREFVKDKLQVPLLQVFQSSVQTALGILDQKLGAINQEFINAHEDVVISLIDVLETLRPLLMPLYALSGVVRHLVKESRAHPFRYLELLFDAAAEAQLEGKIPTYQLLGSIFFDCFQVYLRPIRLWMDEGKLMSGERGFFVSESSTTVALPQVWRHQYKLLQTSEGVLHAPRFLHPAAQRIFITGKSVVVLKLLGRYQEGMQSRTDGETKMEFALLDKDEYAFAPFAEAFGDAFDAWIQSKHHTASILLRQLLYESYGLSSGLDAMRSLYLRSDGSASDAFSSAVFQHLDDLSAVWKDRFTLTELAQEAFSSTLDPYRLAVRIDPRGIVQSAVTSRASVRVSLPAICLKYRLNWPAQIVVPDDSTEGYHAVSVFLLQIRRAMHVLEKQRFHSSVAGTLEPGQQGAYYVLRSRVLWFCNILMTYMTTLVLEPNSAQLRQSLLSAADVDEMIRVHSHFVERIISEACLGPKLQPLRDAILDMLDLTIQLEDAQQLAQMRRAKEEQETARLSVLSSPHRTPVRKRKRVDVYVSPREKDEDTNQSTGLRGILAQGAIAGKKPHSQLLRDLAADFERHLRFVTVGLRGAARASRNEAAVKWDLLAEMLDGGLRDVKGAQASIEF